MVGLHRTGTAILAPSPALVKQATAVASGASCSAATFTSLQELMGGTHAGHRVTRRRSLPTTPRIQHHDHSLLRWLPGKAFAWGEDVLRPVEPVLPLAASEVAPGPSDG
eukprot:scaffold682_cov355-Prasinococcus_capsulatus_cf.AAC.8